MKVEGTGVVLLSVGDAVVDEDEFAWDELMEGRLVLLLLLCFAAGEEGVEEAEAETSAS